MKIIILIFSLYIIYQIINHIILLIERIKSRSALKLKKTITIGNCSFDITNPKKYMELLLILNENSEDINELTKNNNKDSNIFKIQNIIIKYILEQPLSDEEKKFIKNYENNVYLNIRKGITFNIITILLNIILLSLAISFIV